MGKENNFKLPDDFLGSHEFTNSKKTEFQTRDYKIAIKTRKRDIGKKEEHYLYAIPKNGTKINGYISSLFHFDGEKYLIDKNKEKYFVFITSGVNIVSL